MKKKEPPVITVSILINGNPLYTRSAVNTKTLSEDGRGETICEYTLDDGQKIRHTRQHGAVELGKKMLETIVEVR